MKVGSRGLDLAKARFKTHLECTRTALEIFQCSELSCSSQGERNARFTPTFFSFAPHSSSVYTAVVSFAGPCFVSFLLNDYHSLQRRMIVNFMYRLSESVDLVPYQCHLDRYQSMGHIDIERTEDEC